MTAHQGDGETGRGVRSVRRYRIDGSHGEYGRWTYHGMERDESGSWVPYDDHADALAAARAEVDQWRRAFADVARELGCLYATTPDGNDHVLRKARQLVADLAAVRKVEEWIRRGTPPTLPEHYVAGLTGGQLGAFAGLGALASGLTIPALGRALAAQEGA